MNVRLLVVIAAIAGLMCFGISKYKPAPADLPPNPADIINGTRDKLTPFRFNMTTDPASPNYNNSIVVKVHVIDSANQPADGVTLTADFSMGGMAQQVVLEGKGGGEYEGRVNLEQAGNWDVDLTATKDEKRRQQRLNLEVGG
jgi:hypothetical protein